MSLIIDDGSNEKHQRENLFSEEFQYIGIGCAIPKNFKLCTVINYAKDLYPLGEAPPEKMEYDPNYLQNRKTDKELNPFQLDDLYASDILLELKLLK